MADSIAANRVHYRETTASQRRVFFQIWKERGNVSEACRRAKVGRNTLYYWKPRFDSKGYVSLEDH